MVPWCYYHGTPVRLPWDLCGASMGLPWGCGFIHATSVVLSGCFRGISLGYSWGSLLRGSPMVLQLKICGASKGIPREFRRTFMARPWDFQGTPVGFIEVSRRLHDTSMPRGLPWKSRGTSVVLPWYVSMGIPVELPCKCSHGGPWELQRRTNILQRVQP